VHQQIDVKRRRHTPDAGTDSNQTAAQLLRERLQRRSEPANAGAERTAGSATQQGTGNGFEQRCAVRLKAELHGDRRGQHGMAEAPPALAVAEHAPLAAAGTADRADGASVDAAVPQCVRRMAAAGDNSEVVFLGTGCAEPSKYRGASGILVRSDTD
jgi:hypothetical protein